MKFNSNLLESKRTRATVKKNAAPRKKPDPSGQSQFVQEKNVIFKHVSTQAKY